MNTPKFDAKVIAVHDRLFLECSTNEDFMSVATQYYQEHFNLMRMGLPAVKNELNNLSHRYQGADTDEKYAKWASALKALVCRHKCLAVPAAEFDAMEYLAVTWIAGSRGTADWVRIFKSQQEA